LGEPDGIIAFDPSSFPKRGTHSVGVKRQWCGHRGKVDNCQVGVYMGYVSRHDHALLDFRLYLPKEWARDEPRRQTCHVPPEVRYHTRHEQCLEMLDMWGGQVPHGWVTGDDELGRHTWFRWELRERGERYVLGVPCNTTIRDLEAPSPEYQGRGRRPKAPWQSVSAWRKSLASHGWTRLTVRDGEKGPIGIEMIKRRVQTRLERKRTGPEEWLVVTRRVLSSESTLEGKASPDATEQDGPYRYHYYLTPTCVSEAELQEPSLAELARVIKAGVCIEASFKRGKGEAGMDAYQARTWQGWHHHMVLSLIAVWFLVCETHRGTAVDAGLDPPTSTLWAERTPDGGLLHTQYPLYLSASVPPINAQRVGSILPLSHLQVFAIKEIMSRHTVGINGTRTSFTRSSTPHFRDHSTRRSSPATISTTPVR
jgi:SRSO17 transposase